MISDNSKSRYGTKPKITPKELLSYVVSILLSLVFLYFAFAGVDASHLLKIISGASLWWIFVFALLTLLGHYLRALRWKVILSSIKKDVEVGHLFGSLLIGYGVNNVVPRLGEISRAVSVGQLENISRSSIFGTIVVERVIDIIFFGIAVVLSAFLYQGNLYAKFPWLKLTMYFGSALIFIVILILVLSIRYKEKFYSIILFLTRKFSVRFAEKIASIFEKLTFGFSSLSGWKNYSLTIFFSVLIMLTYGYNSYVGFLIFDMHNAANINLISGWVVMSISSIGVMIPTPGGIGSYHTITKSVLVSLYSFLPDVSIAYATLTHAISYIIHSVSALFYFFYFRKKYAALKQTSLFDLEEKN
ncbi:MAG: flippase-like domain-containing protein [Ignavibacteriaceae bacterium]|nr:flippase-like domain-containing protein [Ignavibacteriaceae bacterium]